MCYHSSNSSGNCHDLHFCKEVQKNLLPGKSATPMANNDESDSGRDRRSWQRERRRSESPRPKRRPGVSIPPHRREDGARNDVGRESRRHRSRSAIGLQGIGRTATCGTASRHQGIGIGMPIPQQSVQAYLLCLGCFVVYRPLSIVLFDEFI